MKRRSSYTSCLLACALCAAFLAACSEEDNSANVASPDEPQAPVATVITEPPAEPVEQPEPMIVDAIVEPIEQAEPAVVVPAIETAQAPEVEPEPAAVPEIVIDLPMPEASLVTITGHEQDDSIATANAISNAGNYRVMVELGDAGIAVGVPFDLHISYEMADGTRAPGGVFLDADAYMPHHFHGMNVIPRARPTARGAYDVRGMVFHMTGRWEVYLDLTHKGITERAQFVFEVE